MLTSLLFYLIMHRFPECTSIAFRGATCSGNKLLSHKNEMFENPPEKVLNCSGIYQPLYESMEKELPFITFQQGLSATSDLEALAHEKKCNLVCLYDLMESVTTSSEMEKIFVKGMHHRHLSIIFLNQNMYCQGKHSRTINLNTYILVLMENPRDLSQI